MNQGVVSAKSQLQKLVALSTSEAETIALCESIKDALSLKLLCEFFFDFLSCQIGGQGTGRRPAPALPQRSSKQAATVHTAKADTEAALGV